jgi:hypothetical protein
MNLEPFLPLFPGQPVPMVAPLETVPASDAAPEQPAAKKARKVRARDGEGQFAADDPATPDVNEAWVAEEGGNTEA